MAGAENDSIGSDTGVNGGAAQGQGVRAWALEEAKPTTMFNPLAKLH